MVYYSIIPYGYTSLAAISELSLCEFSCLLVFLTEYRPNKPYFYLSAEKLAKLANCHRGTAQSAILKLIKVGFITQYSNRVNQNSSKAYLYTVNTQPIAPDELMPRRGYDKYGDNGKQYASEFPEGEYAARHFRLLHNWLRLPAWLSLSPLARRMLFHMHSLYYPNKKVFNYSKSAARTATGCSNAKATEALQELTEKGWIARADDGMYYLQQYGDGTPNSKKDGFKKWKGSTSDAF